MYERLRDRSQRVDRAGRVGPPSRLEHATAARAAPSPGPSASASRRGGAPELTHLVLVEAHLRALVGSGTSSPRPACRRRAPASGGAPRARARRRSTCRARACRRCRVVRLPERARVGRDREAADLRPCCARPTARSRAPSPRARRAPRHSRSCSRAGSAASTSGSSDEARVREDREPADARRARPRARACGAPTATSASSEHRRAEQLVEDLAVQVDVVPDEVRLERRDRAPRAGRSAAR